MKYEEEYKNTRNKDEFIMLMFSKYLSLKKNTINRRYYDLRKRFGKQPVKKKIKKIKVIEKKYLYEERMEPPYRKILDLEDMKRYKYKITRELLKQYGWNDYEVNWLDEKNEL